MQGNTCFYPCGVTKSDKICIYIDHICNDLMSDSGKHTYNAPLSVLGLINFR